MPASHRPLITVNCHNVLIEESFMHRQYFVRPCAGAIAALAIAGAATVASAQTSTIIVAPTAPPPPRVETMPPLPPHGQVMTWQAGHWVWNGTAWAWVDGQYVQRPQPTAQWEPGHWSRENVVDGRWRS
jgi:hypothetical protein